MTSIISGVSLHEKNYPPLLKEISGAPEHLFFLGNPHTWEGPLVSIVGTRKASGEGKHLARHLAEAFAHIGVGIVSGLALGIDAAAHEGALAGNGITIAVLANGLDCVYPKTNERLAKEILGSGGAIVSEYPHDAPPLPHQFLERNRIVSGLSLATVVIEAPERSGALSTARNALEQGREVFVFPGPANSPAWRGSHWLIRQGARLATSLEDIKDDLSSLAAYVGEFGNSMSWNAEKQSVHPRERDGISTQTSESQHIMAALLELGGNAKTEDIVASSGLKPEVALATLSFLTIEGELEEIEGGFCIKR